MTVSPFDPELLAALTDICDTPHLLVSTDFDGTISAITNHPAAAIVHPVAFTALRALTEVPLTSACIISGRALADLRSKLTGLERVRLVGTHGSEFDTGLARPLTEDQRSCLTKAKEVVRRATRDLAGSLVEEKPHSVVFHYRMCDLPAAERVVQAVNRELAELGTGNVRGGHLLTEFLVVDTDKGQAFSHVRHMTGATAALFMGDDVTDEDAFRFAKATDVTIKIGPGETAAKFRIGSVEEAVQVLVFLAEHRRRAILDAPASPIDRHGFLSDLRTFALTNEEGRVVWLSFPRLDSPPVFGELVGGRGCGYFAVGPVGGGAPIQKYDDGALVLTQTWPTMQLCDFLDASAGRAFQRAGRSDFVRVLEGSGAAEIVFAPRPDFGRVPTRLTVSDFGVRVEGGTLPMFLSAPGWEWTIVRDGIHETARGLRTLVGESVPVVLHLGTAQPAKVIKTADQMRAETGKFWSLWLKTLKLPSLRQELVARSALVLRGLSYGPTGAIAAAATTSLPESVGGVRNWDYRFCWPRDAALSATALARLGATGPGVRLLDWLLGALEEQGEGEFIRPLYSVTGRGVPTEAEVTEALGYRASRPVRVGNLAAHQLQLDVLGPIAELLRTLAEAGVALSLEHTSLVDHMVNLVSERWREPDHGIWEIRGSPRHYVHSKIMCWYTVAEAQRTMAVLGIDRPEWPALADEIRRDIETNGYSEKAGSYIAAYGLEEADAALLWIVLTGFHSPDHPRSVGTVQYLDRLLVREDAMYRYIFDDGLPGKEGSWYICLAWLIEALVMQGNRKRAEQLFRLLCERTGPLGLYAEQWELEGGGYALGNYPQAYSHVGIINAALALSRA